VHALASVMDVHPLTVLMRCYLLLDDTATLDSLITRIREEVTETPPL
jgi:hypothetical protein